MITNFINASSSFRSSESNWTPICLPKFNDQGFLHALVCFIAQDICLLLISTQTDAFEDLSKRKNTIVEVRNLVFKKILNYFFLKKKDFKTE